MHSPILLEPSRPWHQAVNWRRSDARLPGCTPVAGQGPHERHTLRALDGLRISEALSADIDALGLERGHGTLSGCPDGPVAGRLGADTVLVRRTRPGPGSSPFR
jgi:hypothetical protein